MPDHITTPFGRRSLTAAQITAQAVAVACPAETTIDKWAVLRHVATARAELGLSDRTVAVLSALLSFHPETALCIGKPGDLVVFPSNQALAGRAHNIGEKTLRRHLAVLVEAGLIVRRDSPNGKRYARKGEGGQITEAYGFDLAALVARADVLAAAAARIDAGHRADRLARERLTLARRDLTKLIAFAREAGIAGPWNLLSARAEAATVDLGRRPDRVAVETAGTILVGLVAEASRTLRENEKTADSTGNAERCDRHHQNSNPKALESEKGNRVSQEEPSGLPTTDPRSAYPLAAILDACPDISDYARGRITTWTDLVDTAGLVRSLLGISPSIWREAQDVLGSASAAALVAAILQRAEYIRSPGGYLRALVERKRAGRFSLGPVLQALQRRRLAQRSDRIDDGAPTRSTSARPNGGFSAGTGRT